MNRQVAGWLWVAGQVVFLGALILAPRQIGWPTPSVLRTIADVIFYLGLALILVAALRLGTSLTPSPVPTSIANLKTSGLYKYVRHPIYTGVLVVVAGMTLRSGSWLHLVIALATVVFFDRKAVWEEGQLAERYPDYGAYAARTPKFFPGIGRARPD